MVYACHFFYFCSFWKLSQSSTRFIATMYMPGPLMRKRFNKCFKRSLLCPLYTIKVSSVKILPDLYDLYFKLFLWEFDYYSFQSKSLLSEIWLTFHLFYARYLMFLQNISWEITTIFNLATCHRNWQQFDSRMHWFWEKHFKMGLSDNKIKFYWFLNTFISFTWMHPSTYIFNTAARCHRG